LLAREGSDPVVPLGPIDRGSLPLAPRSTAVSSEARARLFARGTAIEREVTELRAPTGAELIESPIVQQAIEAAWIDSKSNDPAARHEEGGWIYMNVKTGQVFTARAPVGAIASIDLSTPIHYVDSVVVGTFHIHPHPSSEGWVVGPSASDVAMEMSRGTPGIIRSDQGYEAYGWERRTSLSGSWAYPGTPERPLW
jgi:hypothetical protein